MLRPSTTSLLVIGLSLAAVGLALTIQLRRPPSPTEQAAGPWQRWRALPPHEQADIVKTWREVSARPDATAVFGKARSYSAFPASQQDQLRELNELREKTLQAQPPATRMRLRSLPSAARAMQLYRLIEQSPPKVVD